MFLDIQLIDQFAKPQLILIIHQKENEKTYLKMLLVKFKFFFNINFGGQFKDFVKI